MVVSGGDVANVPWRNLESYLMRLLEIETIRDIRLATKALMGAAPALAASPTWSRAWNGSPAPPPAAASTSPSTPTSTTPSRSPHWSPRPPRPLLDVGVRDVRNQGVLMRGVNATTADLLDLCFALQGEAGILPYYFYMCDMIPNAEHWRVAVWQAQQLQHDIMGYLPGYATPRIVCDVPLRRQALGAHAHRVRPRARHLVLDQELPHLH